jgi:hypothetical protein
MNTDIQKLSQIYSKVLTESATQEYASDKTSRPQVAKVFKIPGLFKPNTRNADIGGGKYDLGTEYLRTLGVTNIVTDKFNRPDEYNQEAQKEIDQNPTDTATVNNVLNVIKEQSNREAVIRQAMKAIKPTGVAYFLVFEGWTNNGKVAGDGIGRETSMGWQNYLKTQAYMPEVQKYFNDVVRKGTLIVARSPKYK